MKGTAILLLCAVALASAAELRLTKNGQPCNCNPNDAWRICDENWDKDDIFVVHQNCDQFYKCANGRPVVFTCSNGLLYNPFIEDCDWPENVDCGDRPISGGQGVEEEEDCDEEDNVAVGDSQENGGGNGDNEDEDCEDNENGGSDNGGGGNGDGGNGGGNNNGTCNCNPEEAPQICAAPDSDSTLIAHENCNHFYQCLHGRPITVKCYGTLHYNPYIERCDWPENVDCGDRIIPEPEDNDNDGGGDSDENGNGDGDNGGGDNGGGDSGGEDNGEGDNGGGDTGGGDNGGGDNGSGGGGSTCNCRPEEAPEICASDGSEGVLIAHENCNQFYKCANGVPVVLNCYGDLLYDPYTERCDWPANIVCGDRIIPDPDENDNNGNGDGGSGGGNGDGGSDGGNGGSEGGDNGSTGGGNCDPSEAPAICAAEGSESVLVAHENCNQFYICNGGKPVVLSCSGILLFNPNTDQCDWPENVDCGDRIIPDPDENDNNGNGDGGSGGGNGDGGSGGGSGDGGSGGGNGDGGSGGGNGDNGSGGGNNNSTCNCNPGEAPEICASNGTEGVLIAHENCNQFYKCANGKPVAFTCFGNLLYNPYTEQCDWPQNVECGDRVIPEPDENDNNGNGDGGSGGGNGDGGSDGGNGGSEGGDNGSTGGGNCDPSEAPAICAAEGSESVLVAHENCNQFYICNGGKPVVLSCSGILLFNPNTDQCDWPENVDCGDRIIPDPDENDNNGNGDGGSGGGNGDGGSGAGNGDGGSGGGNGDGGSGGGNGDNGSGGGNNNSTCNCNPGEAPEICASNGTEGVLIAHENCNQFYKCANGKPVAFTCFGNLLYNPYTEQCDWPQNVECGDRVIPDPDENDNNGDGDGGSGGGNGDGGSGGGNEDGGSDGGNGGSEGGDNGSTGGGNCDPSEAPAICAAEGSESVLVAHENCNQFYICNGGKPVVLSCSGILLFNPNTDQCDWPENVDCGDRIIPDPDQNDNNGNGDGGSGGGNGDGGSGGGNGDGGSGGGNGDGGSGGGNGDNGSGGGNNNSTCNCNPGEAPEICASNGTEGVLIAHENCNQFYKCANGKPVAFTCFGNLLYNPYTEQCDWPQNVECGDRVIPEPDENDNNGNGDGGSGGGNGDGGSDGGNGGSEGGDNGSTGGGNCDPSEAPAICAAEGSESVLVAHENCNQFYICNGGKPVVLSCSGILLFNPNTDQCDWPENVDCGDRIIPDPDENDNNGNGDGGSGGGNGDGGSGAGNGDGGSGGGNGDGGSGGGNGDNGSGGGNNNSTCNCNPGEAPEICASNGTEGVLIAHENCNQFYKCANGKPVAFTCFGNLLYNPYTEQCDWPQNVECGDRVIPDPDENDNNGDGDGGSGGGNGDGGSGGGNEDGGSDGGNGDGGNGDNGSGGGNNNSTCNCNPGEAPEICASNGTEGVLIAHENCNQFYKCANGKPVALTCFGNLLYNPYTEQCDWPQNVECGDRVIPDPDENDNNGNGDGGSGGGNGDGGSDGGNGDSGSGSGNGDSGNGDNGSGGGNNNSTCNCNPGEAPEICAINGSEGVLIAHENCNQFYQCSHGRPVALTCFGTLLYNPYTERCDWPQNVDCGDRIIPDPDENDNGSGDNGEGENEGGDSGGGDNGGGDNGGGDNGGSCNCNPELAPGICATNGSEGVLIAHENCNQFYKCANGVPVALTCNENLLYDPYTERCDWPQNVDCGERVVPDTEDGGNGDNGGGDNGGGDNGGGDSGNGDSGGDGSGGGDNGGGDSGNGDNGEGDNEDNNNDINDPSLAPEVCSGSGADGTLVAHANCDQYYMCSAGLPIAMNCSGDLLFNLETRLCDWPRLVDCGNRTVPESGGCLCNPRQAPAVCSGAHSEGLVIAHENCDQFFVCTGGVPVERSCGGGLNYDPHREVCDWPANVACEGRVSRINTLNKHTESRQTFRN